MYISSRAEALCKVVGARRGSRHPASKASPSRSWGAPSAAFEKWSRIEIEISRSQSPPPLLYTTPSGRARRSGQRDFVHRPSKALSLRLFREWGPLEWARARQAADRRRQTYIYIYIYMYMYMLERDMHINTNNNNHHHHNNYLSLSLYIYIYIYSNKSYIIRRRPTAGRTPAARRRTTRPSRAAARRAPGGRRRSRSPDTYRWGFRV